MDWWDVAAGVATGGLYTLGRAGVEQLTNQGRGTQSTLDEIGGAISKGANWLGIGDDPASAPNMGAAAIPGYEDWRAKLAAGGAAAGQRAGPTIDTGPQSQVRGQQAQLSQMLMDQAQGRGPSIAQEQLRQGTDRNMAQAMAMGAAQGAGSRGAGTLRQIANQRAGIGQQMAGDASMLRLQEQMAARGMLGQQLGGMRGQDIGLATDQARTSLQQQAMNDDLVKF